MGGIIALAVFAVVLAYFILIYNGLVVIKNNVAKEWANIDVLLKQRHDELPKWSAFHLVVFFGGVGGTVWVALHHALGR